jgi:phosphoribosylformimino-5-aminoimidazole carboxamide ribotide isomerase
MVVRQCAQQVFTCYVDRGCRSPDDLLEGYHIKNIVGTETGGAGLSQYGGGFLSIDIRDGLVIPDGRDPVDVLRQANGWKFEGCILLNISAVGTETGISREALENLRSAYHRKLFYGGGVATVADLEMLRDAGFDGAIIATALHHGTVPPGWIRRGRMC